MTEVAFTDRVFQMLKTNIQTNDMMKIEQHTHHPVFVYGTCKAGYYNDWALEDAIYISKGLTQIHFALFNNQDSYPVATLWNLLPMLTRDNPSKGRVAGEVYLIPTSQLRVMDMLEANGTMYKRYSTYIEFTETPKDQGHLSSYAGICAFMYLGKKDYWANHQENLSPISVNEQGILEWRTGAFV